MTSPDNDRQNPPFQTPNPQELKAQTGKDMIAKLYSGQDEDLDDMAVDDNAASDSATLDEAYSHQKDEDLDDMDVEGAATGEAYFKDEQTRALSSSPIINAHLSGS
jgi:hypothetical protein